jgi:histidine triad (HIT) family protein
MDCAYCTLPEIKAREIVRNELAWAFPGNMPIVPGHVLILPIRHVSKISDLTMEEMKAILDLREKLSVAMKDIFGAEGFNYAWNEEKIAGQSVPHFHLHMLPRKKGDTGIIEYEPRKFLYRPGEREITPEEELQTVAEILREKLG